MSEFTTSLENWIRLHGQNTEIPTYRIDNYTLVNNGHLRAGTTDADRLIGGAKRDLLWGDSGNDTLYGNAGNDLLVGGAGDDYLYGGSGNDRLEGHGGDDWLFGGGGKDALFGGRGDDRLYGGKGDDYLCAGSGIDELWGGKGRDTFVFRPDVGAPQSQSTYKDFSLRDDRLRIDDDLLIDGLDRSMFGTDPNGALVLTVAGGHQMVFETLGERHIDALMANIEFI